MALLAPGDRGHFALVVSTRVPMPRGQQAFSLDGKEWETNWIIEHRRVKEKRS